MAPIKKEDKGHKMLPRTLIGKLGGSSGISSTPSMKDMVDKLTEKSFDSPQHDSRGSSRGKLVNCNGLYSGLRQLRCLLQVAAPGVTPEEAVVAAMLDLVGESSITLLALCQYT